MGIFSRPGRKASKPNTNESSSSLTSNNSSMRSPALLNMPNGSSTSTNLGPFSPISAPPPHIPKIAMPKAPDPKLDPAAYLKSIGSVRQRCHLVLGKAKKNQLNHFTVDMSKFEDTTKFVVSIIKRDFAPDYSSIPPHGRWQHFNVGGRDRISALLASFPSSVDTAEKTRRLIDLFLVSVLLDAGAGTSWSYKSIESGRTYKRSEGLAVASLEMFKAGLFSSNSSQPCQVDGEALKMLTVGIVGKALQVSEQNPITGLEGRTNLLIRLSSALNNTDLFGADARPGNMLDFLLAHPTTQATSVPIIPLPTLWSVIIDGLAPIWPPSRTQIDGTSLGDAWPLSTMTKPSSMPPQQPWETIVPFHKLSQWLCYSLMQPMSAYMQIHFAGAELMTGLPEYRNGGLFIDTGVLTLKDEETARGIETFRLEKEQTGGKFMEVVPMFEPSDDVIVEWRAVTVGFLDELLREVNAALGLKGTDALSLPQMLEAGSWKGGREIAEVSRPNTKEPPIMIKSDGTVF